MDEEKENAPQENAEEKPKRRRVVRKAAAKTEESQEASPAAAPLEAPAESPAAEGEAPAEERAGRGHYVRDGYKNRDGRTGGRFNPAARRPNFRPNRENMAPDNTPTPENSPDYDQKPRLQINELTKKSMIELREMAKEFGFSEDDLAPMKKQDLIFVILKAHTEHGGIIFASRIGFVTPTSGAAPWKSFQTATAFCEARKTHTFRVRTTFTFRPAKSGFSTLRRATRFTARQEAPRRASASLPCCA